MAVEKMYLVNMSAKLEDVDSFLDDVIDGVEIQPVDAYTQIENRNFSIEVSEENLNRTVDFNDVVSFQSDGNNDIIKKIEELQKYIDFSKGNGTTKLSYEQIDSLYNKVKSLIDRKEKLEKEKMQLEEYIENLRILDNVGIDINQVKQLKYFNFRYGSVSPDGRYILKNNYKNIPSLIIHLKNDDPNHQNNIDALEKIYDIDNKTRYLNENTTAILENETKANNDTLLSIEKNYVSKMKIEGQKLYDEIIKSANDSVLSLNKVNEDKISYLENFYKDKKTNLVTKYYNKIIEN